MTANLIIMTVVIATTARLAQYSGVVIVPNPCLNINAIGADGGK
jgi:hypothetical protein